jgi:hypothetical protein
MKVAAVFIESKGEGSLVRENPSTLLVLYACPWEGGYVANAVTRFYGRSGLLVRSTARAFSVIDEIVLGRLKS